MNPLPELPNRLRLLTAHTLRTGSAGMSRLADAFTPGPTGPTGPTIRHKSAEIEIDQQGPDLDDRANFAQLLGQAMDDAAQLGGVCAVLQVDLDQFSALNATYGHELGNEVLREVGERISRTLRPSDAIARLRRDEFVIACHLDASSGVQATDIAQRIHRSLDRPISTSASDIRVTVAIGTTSVAGAAIADTTAQLLIQEAETASRQASSKGRSQLVAFDAAMHQQAAERYRTEHELRSAIRNDNLEVHYQPFYNLHSGTIAGVEALTRWPHASLGAISPGLFIPVAEESGLIDDLGLWVMNTTIDQAAAWVAATPETAVPETGSELVCTINLSSRQLLDPALTQHVDNALRRTGVNPATICFEITESVVMSDVATSMNILGELKDLGVMLAIDDFGTGYSSLSYLRQLPVDILKIDMSFVQSVHNRDDRMITRAIIDLAHTLGMTTVAEGVESMLQVEILDALKCDMAQGYLLHYPAPVDKLNLNDLTLDQNGIEGHGTEPQPNAARIQPL